MADRHDRGAHSRPVGRSKPVWVIGAILLLIVIILGIWGFVYGVSDADNDRVANTIANAPDH